MDSFGRLDAALNSTMGQFAEAVQFLLNPIEEAMKSLDIGWALACNWAQGSGSRPPEGSRKNHEPNH